MLTVRIYQTHSLDAVRIKYLEVKLGVCWSRKSVVYEVTNSEYCKAKPRKGVATLLLC